MINPILGGHAAKFCDTNEIDQVQGAGESKCSHSLKIFHQKMFRGEIFILLDFLIVYMYTLVPISFNIEH